MLIESLAGLVTVRRRLLALRFGSAMGEPLFGGAAFGVAAGGALAGDPQIDDLGHVRASMLTFAGNCADTVASGRELFRANCADTVARHGWVNECNDFGTRIARGARMRRVREFGQDMVSREAE